MAVQPRIRRERALTTLVVPAGDCVLAHVLVVRALTADDTLQGLAHRLVQRVTSIAKIVCVVATTAGAGNFGQRAVVTVSVAGREAVAPSKTADAETERPVV